MGQVLTQIGRFWKRRNRRPAAPEHFEVECDCGQIERGYRTVRHQAVTCSKCGRTVFVLPLSSLPSLGNFSKAAAVGSGRKLRGTLGIWRFPLAAGVCSLVAMISLLVLFLNRSPKLATLGGPPQADAPRRNVESDLETGRRALARGQFRLAMRTLEAALLAVPKDAADWNGGARSELSQLYRQAALFGDLATESLEDILRHAADLFSQDENEWEAVFRQRYDGKSFVLFTEVRGDGAKEIQLGYRISVAGLRTSINLSKLEVLQGLALWQPQRLLFGFRLGAVRLEPGGVWVVHPDPKSGVLITDLDAAVVGCSLPAEELKEVVERQRAWFNDPHQRD